MLACSLKSRGVVPEAAASTCPCPARSVAKPFPPKVDPRGPSTTFGLRKAEE